MEDGGDEHIKSRAYELWEKEGRPEGKDKEHWSQAEKESGPAGGSGDAGAQRQEGAPVGTVADVPVIGKKRTARQPSASARPLQSKENKNSLLDAGNVTRGKNG